MASDWDDYDPIPMDPFPARPDESARARAYALAKKLGQLDTIPADWNEDGSLKSERGADEEVVGSPPSWATPDNPFNPVGGLNEGDNEWHPDRT
jgi:hypothetical protein